jgi:hypothetical protein
VQALRDPRQHPARRGPEAAGYADLEARNRVLLSILRNAELPATGAHDQTNKRAEYRAVRLGASGRREVKARI